MTENEKARELIATSETTVKVDPQNGWYLKRFAALQFEGSVDNFGTNMPIHVLEQQLPKEDTMKLDDAVIEGQEIDYSRFYDEKGNEYSSVSELVQTRLGLDDDDAIQEYNKENPGLPYIPYEKLRDMDKKDIPEMLSSVVDEADYVDAYKEVTHVASYHVEVTPMSNNYEAMGFAFTHQGLKEYEKSIDNHIFYPCRCYAHAGEKYGREAGDFYPIMEFLHSAGEQLLREDIRRYDIKPAVIRTKEEMHEFYRTQPDEMILAALVEVDDKVIGVQQESVDFHRAVSASVNSVDFGEFAKCLANDHINIGQNRLMAWLRKEKYIDASNIAYQKYIQQGIFEVKETVYYIGKASHTARKTLITPKGQVYLAKKVSSGYKG